MGVKQDIREGRNPLLELCPFCGEPGEIFCVPGEQGCRVRCSNRDCFFRPSSNESFSSEDLAVKSWNARKGMAADSAKGLDEVLSRESENRL